MKWSNIKLIFLRELRDQLRDRRTLLTILALPLLLYPLLGMTYLQMAQFLKTSPTRIWIIGTDNLPESVPLLDSGKKTFHDQHTSESLESLLEITVAKRLPDSITSKNLASHARQEIDAENFEVIVYFPNDFVTQLEIFHERVADYRRETDSSAKLEQIEVPAPTIYINTAKDKSQLGLHRVENILKKWRQALVEASFRDSQIPVQAGNPFDIKTIDVAKTASKQAAIWGKILPFFVLVWALAGAFYPAVDLCAGEKERGTLETLLCSPADRREIVWGKMITIMVFSIITALLNLLSLGITGALVFSQISQLSQTPLQVGAPPLHAIGWLLVALVPISALFSALALSVAAFARSTKEGQYYLMPLLLICMPLMTLSMLPNVELELGTSIIPITGMMLLLRTVVEQQYLTALKFVVPVLSVTALCCWLASRWAIAQFNNESVLFNESERWNLRLWWRQLIHKRGETPTVGVAISCGLLLLIVRFFTNFLQAEMPDSWSKIVSSTLLLHVGLMLGPTLLFAFVLTRRPSKTFLLQTTSPTACLLAILLAVTLHPLVMQLTTLIQWVYPMSPEMLPALQSLETLMREARWWQVVLLMALVPAIGEELIFRGFLLSGFRRLGNIWFAMILSSLFFGIIHGILQQSMNAFVIGLIISYLAIKTSSIIPCVLYHLTHNTLSVLHLYLDSVPDSRRWLLEQIFYQDKQQVFHYQPTFIIVASLVAVGVMAYYVRRPLHLSPAESLQRAIQHPSDHD